MSTVTGLKPARYCSTCWLSASVSAATRKATASRRGGAADKPRLDQRLDRAAHRGRPDGVRHAGRRPRGLPGRRSARRDQVGLAGRVTGRADHRPRSSPQGAGGAALLVSARHAGPATPQRRAWRQVAMNVRPVVPGEAPSVAPISDGLASRFARRRMSVSGWTYARWPWIVRASCTVPGRC